MDLDEERPDAPHAVARAGRCLPQRRADAEGRLRVGGVGCSAERVGDAGEVLDDAVVEVGGDAPSLVGRSLDGADEERLAILLAAAKPVGETPGERHLYEPEEDEAGEQERGEREPDPAPGRRDRAAALIGLEQQRRPVRRADRKVDLVQAALPSLESVLRARRGCSARRVSRRCARASSFELSSG